MSKFFQKQKEYEKQDMESRKKKIKRFTREQTIEFYIYSEKIRIESMAQLSNFAENMKNQVELTYEMIKQQTIMKDKLFFKYGIEDDEFNEAIVEHKVTEDPEVQAFIKKSMEDLPPEVMQNLMMQMMNQRGEDPLDNDP